MSFRSLSLTVNVNIYGYNQQKENENRIDQVEEHVLNLLTKYPNTFLEGTLMWLWITS